ncbi:hypothetical protein IMZ38_01665 [Thermosphaera chiliense]|uniref:Uncharacterized protein n=1 Tax=Thermosphaera chiliense TaxID=3402707 RepID=A0A7M1URS4_9CREN|nr:hypothetical protein [Thermosphaera aggregans]QOR94669.1 hypothetical protein IMZ38_01665 [Thermosphaera aggregans]
MYSDCIMMVKRVLGNHREGELIRDKFLFTLFSRYSKFHEKTRGKRVVGFEKSRSLHRRVRGGHTLYAVLEDGSRVDWSYRKACEEYASLGSSKSRINDVIRAFREEVEPDIGSLSSLGCSRMALY